MKPEEKTADKYDLLAQKWLDGTITPGEAQAYAAWYNAHNDTPLEIPASFSGSEQALAKGMLNTIQRRIHQSGRMHVYRRIAAAAAILILFGGGYYFYQRMQRTGHEQVRKIAADIVPGHSGAILTLSDGSQVVLDSAGNGTIAKQGSVQVLNKNGKLAYETGTTTAAEIIYNTLSTPKGRQYEIILPDGSHVWLNAGSSLNYPTAFSGATREVTLTGEGYFEIAHNAAKPFHVKVGNMDVRVLGTHFNINAYSNEEDICTTLLEGAVTVTDNKVIKHLLPGQQSRLNTERGDIQVKEVDAEAAVAWKNGFFQFDGTDLPSVLRQLSRWYNIEVKFQGPPPELRLGGKLKRSLPLSGVLKLFKEGNIHYTLQGNLLTILS